MSTRSVLAASFILFLFTAQDAPAQIQHRAYLIETPKPTTLSGTRQELTACVTSGDKTTCGGSVVELPVDPYLATRARTTRDKKIVIRFFKADGTPATAAEATAEQLWVRVPGMRDQPIPVPSDQVYGIVDLIEQPYHDVLHSAAHRTLISVLVQDATDTQLAQFHSRIQNRWEPYGVELFDADVLGVWLPVGVFATNFEISDNGIEFAALPVGLALGGKHYIGRGGFYLGASAIGMYSVMSVDDEATTEEGQRLSLSNLAAGGMLDLGGLLYVSVTQHFDFGEEVGQKTMLGVGAGPTLLRIIGGGGRAPR